MNARIGVIAAELPPATGGVQRFNQHVIEQLCKRGRDVVVVTARNHPGGDGLALPLHKRLRESHRHDRRVLEQLRRSEGITSWLAMSAGYAWIAKDFAHIPTDVMVHGNDFALPYPLCARPLLWGLWPPQKLSSLELALSRALTRRLIDQGLRAARRIMANSRYTAHALQRQYHAIRDRHITVTGVGSGIDGPVAIDDGARASVPGKSLKLLTVCRLESGRKNVRSVIDAVQSLLDHGHAIDYTIVGDGSDLDALRQEVAARGLSERVHLPGRVAESALHSAYASADLFVLTPTAHAHDFEGFGMVYIEANTYGLPVLASRAGGCGEAVLVNETGLLVDEPTPRAIERCVLDFMSRRGDFQPENCRRFAAAFSWESVVDAIETGIDHAML